MPKDSERTENPHCKRNDSRDNVWNDVFNHISC